MPRPPREDYEGAWHHVMNRGTAGQTVFASDDDRRIFLDCLARASERYGVEVHGYCLLGNHYHLLVHSTAGKLPGAMRWLAGRFTQRINYRNKRDGALFRGRYHSVAIDDDAHLVRVSRYIHRNPVEARLAADPADWPWSSATAYLESEPAGLTPAKPSWLRTDLILAMFGAADAVRRYRSFLAAEVDRETRETYRDWS
jgi:putative transposase